MNVKTAQPTIHNDDATANPSVWNISRIRSAFPALDVRDEGRARIYLDAPGGTQVPQRVIDRMTDCLTRYCGNEGGVFPTSLAATGIMEESHRAMADLVGAADENGIVFGYNMTSLIFHFSKMLSRDWRAGDNIVLTRMDHDGNVAAWIVAAREKGVEVRWLEFDEETFAYRYEQLDTLIDRRTQLVACNHASNFLGTVNDVARIAAAARNVGAISVVDAVQSVPHLPIDIEAIGCDVLVCSAYKFFGPHVGILVARAAILETLDVLKVRPATDVMPYCFELGTPSFEAQAGTSGAVDHFAWLGEVCGGLDPDVPRRARILSGLDAARAWEDRLTRRMLSGLRQIKGVRLMGIAEPERMAERVPTFTFTVADRTPLEVAEACAQRNMFVWSGNFYALEAVRSLGIERDGAVRVGLAHYNDETEIDLFLDKLETIATGHTN